MPRKFGRNGAYKATTPTRLRRIREEADLTQSEFAFQLGVSQGLACKYEKGQAIPSIGMAQDIARILGCAVEDIYEVEMTIVPVRLRYE